MREIRSFYPNYINGKEVEGGAGRLTVLNPATNEAVAEQALADAGDVGKAVEAAGRLHENGFFRHLRPVERGRMVQAMGKYLLDNIDEIARLLTLEHGKPLWESKVEIEGAARYFEYYGNQAETLEGRSIPLGGNYFDFTSYEPFGVSAHIIPWNYPLEMAARSISAALATGNGCVVKTPELSPLSSFYLAQAASAAAIPAGALNILCGLGEEAGAALSAHPGVNQIVFTGSVSTGRKIAGAAAHNIVPCVLELGSKSAAIVYEDADLEAFENDMRWGIFFNAGQVCSAMSRVIVHKDKYEELVERAVKLARSLSVGPGIDRAEFGANMGAMINLEQRDRALAMVEDARANGANIETGGKAINAPGAFMEPTILTGLSPDMAIASQEIFGPALSFMSFEDEKEALEIANSTDYGLVGGVFTRNIDRAMRAARDIRAGQIFINEWYAGGVETPFGGYGKSGYGREKGREALMNYVQTKNIAVRLAGVTE